MFGRVFSRFDLLTQQYDATDDGGVPQWSSSELFSFSMTILRQWRDDGESRIALLFFFWSNSIEYREQLSDIVEFAVIVDVQR